jgi:hypothetical protein
MATPFLLHPKNQRFLDGKDRVPWSVRPPFWGTLLIGIGSVVFAAGVLGYFWYDMQVIQHLRDNGVTTTALVVQSLIHDGGETDYGSMTFQYTAKLGDEQRTITCTQKTRDSTARRYLQGVRMKVVYDPAIPERVRIADELKIDPHQDFPDDRDYLGLKLIAFFPGVTALMAFTVWFGTALLPLLRLRRNPGKVLLGEILECKGKWDAGDDYQVSLRIRFTTPEGKPIESWMQPSHRDDLHGKPLPAPGTPVQVYYLDEQRFWCL